MEFKLINPDTFVKVIEFNYDDLQKWITEQVEKYQNLSYTDETIKDAKEDRAALNKFRERIDAARKDVKKRYLEPYNNFEEKVKKLLALIEEPAAAIDTQVKEYEERKKSEKEEQIKEYFNAVVGDLSKLLSYDKIFDKKWLNATTNIKSVQTQIDQIIEKVKFDLQTIKDLKSEWELTLIDTYLQTLDIAAALREKTRLEERQKAIMEEGSVEQTMSIEQVANVSEQVNDQVSDQVSDQVEPVKIYTRKFWVKGSADQLRTLGQYMKEHGIEYGGIE
jgi:hypothetical protein